MPATLNTNNIDMSMLNHKYNISTHSHLGYFTASAYKSDSIHTRTHMYMSTVQQQLCQQASIIVNSQNSNVQLAHLFAASYLSRISTASRYFLVGVCSDVANIPQFSKTGSLSRTISGCFNFICSPHSAP